MAETGKFADTIIEKSDFDKDDCQRILAGLSDDKYISMHGAFSEARQKFLEKDNLKQTKVYSILSDACSMWLEPDNLNEPFKLYLVQGNQSSATLNSFSERDISFFCEIIPEVANIYLKARLADIVWVRWRKMDYALIAIDSYRKMPLDTKTYSRDEYDCWRRAISLSISLRGGAGNRVQEMEETIQQTFDSSNESDTYFAVRLVELMDEFDLGKKNAKSIAKKLGSLALIFENNGDLDLAERYYETSAIWYQLAQCPKKSSQMIFHRAKIHVKKAENFATANQPSNMNAHYMYEQAIQILGRIPNSERDDLKVDEYIAKLRISMDEAGKQSIQEMTAVSSSEKIDIKDDIAKARSAVSNKTLIDSLMAFANLSSGIDLPEIQNLAIQQLRDRPSLSLFVGTTHISRDGRVIAKTGGLPPSGDPDRNHPQIQNQVIGFYRIHMAFIAQAQIIPALEVIHLEHRIQEYDFLEVAKYSPIVPFGREALFAKGLYSGYNQDYVTALHILAPQVENMVRYHLKNAGAKTSTLNNGIETLNSLKTLIELPEVEKVFGNNLAFEIKALFCDPLGTNFRNDIAHGLVDCNDLQTPPGVYAWWFTFKLVFNAFLNATTQKHEPAGEEDGDS